MQKRVLFSAAAFCLLLIGVAATVALLRATTGVARSATLAFSEDTREGFPKIAAYRPGCDSSALAGFDWATTDGSCIATLDAAHAQNPSLLGMIQPSDSNGIFAATYGDYGNFPGAAGIRAGSSNDWLHNADGSIHEYGSVEVLNWVSSDTANWSADVVAYEAKQDGLGSSSHPGAQGVWGDNDLWSDQSYAFQGTVLASSGDQQSTWDTNYVLHHQRLQNELPGMVIGGNGTSTYAAHPAGYRGSIPNGWSLPGVSAAGMVECADKYFGLYSASGVDALVTGAQAFLGAKAADGKQRYLMLNDCNATSDQINEFALAVATIGGMYYWPYSGGDWSTTLSIGPAIPDVTHDGRRNWLGNPTAAPQQIASGLWKRTFDAGVVYANMTGSTQTVDGHSLGNETGLFVSTGGTVVAPPTTTTVTTPASPTTTAVPQPPPTTAAATVPKAPATTPASTTTVKPKEASPSASPQVRQSAQPPRARMHGGHRVARGHVALPATASPGPQCGGALWREMTLADNGKSVDWNPLVTTVGDIAKLAPPAKISPSRTTSFQRRVWRLNDVVIERYRQASNGEIILQLYDIPSATYMNAYIPAASCMTKNPTLRKAMLGARTGFLKPCPAPAPQWQLLGAHAVIFGVGFWNPVKTTLGALPSGAELRPLVGLTITQGCRTG